ncbi:MAG: DUF6265 family protein [Steroidobacter sp.]
MSRELWIALVCVLGYANSSGVDAAEQLTTNTLKFERGEAPPRASIEDMAWLSGTWTGSGLGEDNEEIWSAPRHGVMMGMYRMIKEDGPVFYELLTLSETNGSLELRLKHFHADLRGWEERDQSLAFPLLARRGERFYFDGITFEPKGDEVTVYLAIEDRKSGSVREEVFRYKRGVR